jgi:ribonuclease HI
MSEDTLLTIHTDGASRGNPGPAAFAYTIGGDGVKTVEECGVLGRMTNNQAEYTALVNALRHATRLGKQYRLAIKSDSELLVKQMRGEYRVKDPDLRSLYDEARRLAHEFVGVTFQHIRREENTRTDALCNRALDADKPAKAPTKPKIASDEVKREAVACLKAAAAAWCAGNPNNPPPEQVWDQLWSILEEEGVVRTGKKR